MLKKLFSPLFTLSFNFQGDGQANNAYQVEFYAELKF